MKYLEGLGFTEAEIASVKEKSFSGVADRIDEKERLVTRNINFLKSLGVENYKDLFINYSEFFLQDADVFEKIFSKYDRKDLVEKLKKNMAILIRL